MKDIISIANIIKLILKGDTCIRALLLAVHRSILSKYFSSDLLKCLVGWDMICYFKKSWTMPRIHLILMSLRVSWLGYSVILRNLRRCLQSMCDDIAGVNKALYVFQITSECALSSFHIKHRCVINNKKKGIQPGRLSIFEGTFKCLWHDGNEDVAKQKMYWAER